MASNVSAYITCPYYIEEERSAAKINCENCDPITLQKGERTPYLQKYCANFEGMKLCDRFIKNMQIWEVAI